ncbi:MAG: DNA repair protein RecO [Candidatus Marinimicrobia bacterium]|nr:DNA repair protein RecO [Candidatus Neomarinimicrobiota bacterium]MCF7903886.1 DNA repair protein RecO [Candidatus Neomarinimicrobiota bacterium]
MLNKTEAVVLKTLNHGDTSKIITLYSKDTGKLKLIAKGVRSPKSKAAGLFQPTRHLQVVYYEKQRSELQLFKSGELISGFFGLEGDFDRLTLSQVMVELLDRATEDEELHESIFLLVTDDLRHLSEKAYPPASVYWHFHLHLLRELGYRPNLSHCSSCNAELKGGGSLGRSSSHLECAACHLPSPDSIFVSDNTIALINQILDEPEKTKNDLDLAPKERRSLWNFLWRYTFYHIESTRGMRSLKVLNQLYS